MQWHAIQRLDTRPKNDDSNSEQNPLENERCEEPKGNPSSNVDGASNAGFSRESSCVSPVTETNLYNMSFNSDTASSSNDEESTARRIFFPLDVVMPTEAPSIATVAYQRAMTNRHKDYLLRHKEKFDPNIYRPTFLHDILMLPGSLAALLGRSSAQDLVPKITPALLPGYKSHIHNPSLQPALIQSDDPTSYVQGMLVFGLGKSDRRLIHNHYRKHAKRKKVPVEVELLVQLPNPNPKHHMYEEKCWLPQRRALEAHVWLWSTKRGGEDFFEQEWNLEDYLLGNLGPKQTLLRIEGNARGDEDDDGWIGRKVEEVVIEPGKEEEREVVYGGTGGLDYERDESVSFTGW